MSDNDRYLQAERMGEWFQAQASRVPSPLTEEDLAEIEQRAVRTWSDASPDLLRLVAEVRGLRSLTERLKEELDEERLLGNE